MKQQQANSPKGKLYQTSKPGTVFAWLLLIVYLSPLYLVLTIALKTKEDFSKNNFGLPKQIMWENLVNAAKEMNLSETMVSSALVTFCSIAIILLFAAWASFAIGRRRHKGYEYVYLFFMAGMMIPFQLVMLPLYKLVNALGIMGSYWAVICIYVGTTLPVAIVILTGFIKTIPMELDEAAVIDGASPWCIFWKVILPLIKAPLITVMIMCMVNFWNDLLTPLLFFGSKHQTLIVALYNFKGAFYSTDWTMVFAGSIVVMLPLLVIFLITQKYFISGMVAGAVKG